MVPFLDCQPQNESTGMNALGSIAYFSFDGARFHGNDPARGPWSPDHCHAGPVAGLAARAAEYCVGADKQIVRLALDLLRPIPMAGIQVSAVPIRLGGTVATTGVDVLDPEGRLCVSGRTMHLALSDLGEVPTAPAKPLRLAEARVDRFPLERGHGLPSFADFVDILYPPGSGPEPGPKTIWMRVPAIVEGEEPSPFQSLCPLGDCGNGISGNSSAAEMTFLNTDLTIVMHRPPCGDWLSSDAVSHWQRTGIGVSQAILGDGNGPVGAALQTLILRRK